MFLRVLAILPLTVLVSCRHHPKTAPNDLYGRWILDSTSGRDGKIIGGGPREHTEFTLKQDKTYQFQWSDFDVFGEYKGTYTYESNEKGPPKLIFSVYSEENKDSIISKDSMIILNLNGSLLKTQEKESYTTFDSILITRNRINIYRKIAAPNRGF